MKKRGIISLIVISVIAIFAIYAYAQVDGVCYTIDEGEPCAVVKDNCDAKIPFGRIFQAGGISVLRDCQESKGCCCFAVQDGAILSSRVCTNEHIGLARSFNPDILDPDVCNAICSGTIPTCKYQACEDGNSFSVDIEKCRCGTTFSNESYPYCCSAGSTAYDNKNTCLLSDDSACKVPTYKISGTIYNQNNQPLAGATVSTIGASDTTDDLGQFELLNLKGAIYEVLATKQYYTTNSTTVELLQDTTISLILTEKPEDRDSDGDGYNDNVDVCPFEPAIHTYADALYVSPEIGVCKDGTDNDCDGFVDCLDTNCQINEPDCQTASCGDGTIQQSRAEECDVIFNIEGQMVGGSLGECTSCLMSGISTCVCAPECGDNKRSSLETCDMVSGEPVGCSPTSKGCWQLGEYGADGKECTCKPASICGDHVIDSPEECDFNAQTGDGFDINNNFVECTPPGTPNECKIKKWTCGDGIVHPFFEQCEDSNPGDSLCSASLCNDNTCRCPSTCFHQQDKPTLTAALMYQSYNITLSWSSRCPPSSYSVLRNGQVIVDQTRLNTFVDDYDKNPNTQYCYQVIARYNDALEPKTLVSDQACTITGDDICSIPTPDEFCRDNKRVRCNDMNKLEEIQDCDSIQPFAGETHICVGPDDDQLTECLYQSNCEECNGFLGLYYRDGETLYYNNIIPCANILTCYTDFSDTSVDQYYGCDQVDSCYSYRSQQACETNKCETEMASNTPGCEWIPSLYSDLGQGVCRPKDPTRQDCSKCDEPFNSVFGRCDANICKLYGECYYDKVGSSNYCKNSTQVSCEDYDSYEDCTGNVEVLVDVGYELSYVPADCRVGSISFNTPCPAFKNSGTNAITQKSADYFNFGVCKWTSGGCKKDADNRTWENPQIGDCLDPADTACNHDFEPPTTNFLIPLIAGKKSSLVFSKLDNVYPENMITTYYSIVPKGEYAYPRNKTTGNSIFLETVDSVTTSQDYTVYYFSEDFSHNIEEVKSFDIFIDTQPPVITIETVEDAFLLGSQYRTNLAVTMTATDDTPSNSTCWANLTKGTAIWPWLNAANGKSWEYTFENLLDGDYALNYYCIDAVGNPSEATEYITLDADLSITDPLPSGPINTKIGIDLSVRTAEPANCRYSTTPVNLGFDLDANTFAQMTPFAQTGGQFHTTTDLSYVLGPDNQSHIYYVRCLFPDNTFRGTDSDNIKFAIDLQPPELELKVQGKDIQEWYADSSVNVRISCQDPAIMVGDRNMAFGDCKVYYCDNNPTCNPANKNTDVYNYNVNVEGAEIQKGFRYQAKDAGENPSQIFSDTLRIDRISPNFTIVLVDSIGRELNNIGLGNYWAIIYPTEPLSRIENFGFASLNGKVEQLIAGQRTLDVWIAPFKINEHNFENFEDNVSFFINGIDAHGMLGTYISEGRDFYIDTKNPEPPVIEPSLDTYTHRIGDVYCTNQDSLYISGYTLEDPLEITFYKDEEENPRRSYQEIPNPQIDFAIASSGSQGNNQVIFIGDVRSNISAGDYLQFSHFRRIYPNWKNFYRVTNVEQDVQNTRVTLETTLEKNVVFNEQIKIYKNGPYASNWFKQQTDIVDEVNIPGIGPIKFNTGNANLSIYAVDQTQNPSEPVSFTLLWDKVEPFFDQPYPGNNWIVNDNKTLISAKVNELLEGSGVDNLSTKFIVDNSDVLNNFVKNPVECTGHECTDLVYNYGSFITFSEGDHTINVSVNDNAGNTARVDWKFEINTNVPATPAFDMPNSSKHYGKWFTNTKPENFTLYFAETINATSLVTSMGTCITDNGFEFVCDLTPSEIADNGHYSIEVTAAKQNVPVSGRWYFDIVLDRTAPEVNLLYDNTVRSNVITDIDAYILNEDYSTAAYIEIFDQIYDAPLVVENYQGMNYHSYAWNVPELDDGEYYFNMTVIDLAGNSQTVQGTIIIDNTPPDLGILEIIADNIYSKIINDEIVYFTKDTEVTVIGNATGASQIRRLHYFFPAEATIRADNTYSLPVKLESVQWEMIENQVVISAVDESGNTKNFQFTIFADRKPPELISIEITEP